jgi:hypothetical protein
MIKLISAALLLIVFLAVPVPIVAGHSQAVDIFKHTCDSYSGANAPDVCQDVQAQKGVSTNPIIKIFKAAINIITYVVGIAAIIGIVVSGLRFILANGDSNAVASARTGLIYSLIGIAVAVLAQTIVKFVLDKT